MSGRVKLEPGSTDGLDSVDYVRELSMRKIWIKLVQLRVSPCSLFLFTPFHLYTEDSTT